MSCVNKLELTNIKYEMLANYKELMTATTAEDSLYIKAKETITAILNEAGLTAIERANIISQTVAGMVNGLSGQAMQMAFEMAKDGRDSEYILAKMCADTALTNKTVEKIAADIETQNADTRLKRANGWMLQAQLYRDYGVIPSLISYDKETLLTTDYDEDYGTKYESVRLAKANVYTTYAETYRKNGLLGYTTNTVGDLATVTDSAAADSLAKGLTYWQTRVAKRQEQGYDDNMRQHVVNSSAGMISMLLSTEVSGIDYDPFMAQWGNAVGWLNGSQWITTDTTANNSDWKTTLSTMYP